jgi:Iap family predicted aminopeptidase
VRRPAATVLILILLALAADACDSSEGSEGTRSPSAPAASSGTGAAEHLRALARIAARSGGTRSAGTPGDRASAEYIARTLRTAGWDVRMQRVRLPFFDLRTASLSIAGERSPEGSGFRVPSYSGSGAVRGRAHRLEDPCTAGSFDELEPGEIPVAPHGLCRSREAAELAEGAGAPALVLTIDTARDVPSVTLGGPGVGIPVLMAAADSAPGSGERMELSVDARTRARRTRNVLAELPGTGAGDVVMAGGHLDSVDAGPGLNDNGSGVAALLVMADRFAERPSERTVRLGFWAAEELGLVGSRRYVSSLPQAERRRIAAYINLDMVGSPNPVPSVYSDADRPLARVLRRALGRRVPGVPAAGASDHSPFQAVGIPANGIYTGGEELRRGRPRDPCYHLACDRFANVNLAVLRRMTDAAERAVRELAGPQAK